MALIKTSKIACAILLGILSLSADPFSNCFVLFGRENFFFTCGASKSLYVLQYNAVKLKVKLDFNVFNATCRAK